MTANLILQKIQERKALYAKDFVDFTKTENSSVDEIYKIYVRINELDQVIEIIKSCIAAGEDDGK